MHDEPSTEPPRVPGLAPGIAQIRAPVLQHFFGDVNAFEVHPAFNTAVPGPPEGGVRPRRYMRISDMAQEGIAARTYGGMHFRGASNATAVVGVQIADYILANAARPVDDDDADSD